MSSKNSGNNSYPVSDHFDGVRFYNEDRSLNEMGFLDVLKWQVTKNKIEWPDQVDDNHAPTPNPTLDHSSCAITFINHATELLHFENSVILTDPLFSERSSPFSWAGPKRHRKPGIDLHNLPKINIVLVSHNHYDHMDLPSLLKLNERDQPKFIVPLGNKDILLKNGIENVEEIDWWDQVKINDALQITLVPMQHWSSRTPNDRCKALWGGFVIENSNLKILFAGDTGHGQQFKAIEKKFGPMDVSLLPIGAYEPRWFMKNHHMNPEEAVRAHLELRSKLSLGMHFGTFQLTDEGMEDPVIELKKCLVDKKIPEENFIAPKNGQTIFYSTK